MPYTDPGRARAYQRDYRRLRRAGDGCTTPVHPAIPPATRLKTAADVLALLEEQVAAVRADLDAGALEKARTVGYLAGVCLRAIEAGDLAARLEALEAVLKARPGGARAVTAKPLNKLYDRLTPAERLPLIVAAVERGDEAERRRLADSAQRRAYRLPDYYGLGDAFTFLAPLHLLQLLDFAARFAALLVEPGRPGGRGHDDVFDDLLSTGYLLRAFDAGWAGLCAGYAIDPDALLRGLPGFRRARAAVEVAAEASFTDEGAAAHARRTGGGRPLTAADVAAAYRREVEKIAGGWGTPGVPAASRDGGTCEP